MTQAGTAPTLTIKKVTVAPICSPEEARKRFSGRLLDDSHVKMRLTESAQIVTPEGETKFLFLKNVLPAEIVDLGGARSGHSSSRAHSTRGGQH